MTPYEKVSDFLRIILAAVALYLCFEVVACTREVFGERERKEQGKGIGA